MKQTLPALMPGAGPQFYRGDSTGCLIVHGFMASPGEVGWLGSHLAQQGYTVYVPRLTGHGIDPAHMTRMRWQDWYAQVLDSYHLLAQQCDRVFVVGHSMGGLLSLLLASAQPVDGLVVAASPLHLTDWRLNYARLISLLMPYLDMPSEQTLQDTILAEQAVRGESPTGRVHYARWATRATAEIYRLTQVVAPYLADIKVPTLLLYASGDAITQQGDHRVLAKKLVNAPRQETVILEAGGHIIFQDTGRDAAFEAVAAFLQSL